MFLGLLKKAFEQTKFDKDTFLYSEWELAFLTLWSTLNEIQNVHFETNNTSTGLVINDTTGNLHSNRRLTREISIPRHLKNLKIKMNRDYLIAYLSEHDLNGDPINITPNRYRLTRYSKIFRDASKPSGIRINTEYSLLSDIGKSWQYERNLSIQVAFLIYSLAPSEPLDRDTLVLNLIFLNDKIRNKLYLTHGEDSFSPNFALEYEDQRWLDVAWQKHIQQLFEIVYFLCTGKECNWNN